MTDALVWSYEEDNFTWKDAYVDSEMPEPIVCMGYQFDPGWAVRWSDLGEGGSHEATWEELEEAGTRWADFSNSGEEENLYWLTERGLYVSDQYAKTDGQKQYFVERLLIDLNDVVPQFSSARWLYAKQMYFHLASQLAANNVDPNTFEITVGWSDSLMDEPVWLSPVEINLQSRANAGKVKYDFRSTGRYLALRIDFSKTGPIKMTGAEIDVEQTHGR